MSHRITTPTSAFLPLLLGLAGCFSVPLPESMPVTLPTSPLAGESSEAWGELDARDNQPVTDYREVRAIDTGFAASSNPVVTARMHTGPAPMASSVWTLYAVEHNQDELLARAEFGSDGSIARVFDNGYFAPETIGDTLWLDGATHASDLPGTTYAAASYGVDVGSSVSFMGVGYFYVGPVLAATAEVYAYGIMNEEQNRMDGVFGVRIETRMQLPGIDTVSWEAPAFAIRDDMR